MTVAICEAPCDGALGLEPISQRLDASGSRDRAARFALTDDSLAVAVA